MIKLEEITTTPKFSNQLENKILYANHFNNISISYKSTYTLKYVIEGSKYYNFNNQQTKVSKNEYLILNNHNDITTKAKSGTKGLSFFLSPKLINEIYRHYTNSKYCLEFLEVTQKKHNNQIGILLDNTLRLFELNPHDREEQIDNLFIKLTEIIVREQINIDTNFTELKIIKYHTKRELFKLITLAKEYLNDHLSEAISLDDISSNIGISKYYLHRLFTEIHGNTPLEYLTYIRLEKAKNKLRFSKDSIFEISIECGFNNAAYFSNVFKKYMGTSPTQFRKNL